MTFCAPLKKANKETSDSEFYGALCSDLKLTLSSHVTKYLDIDSEQNTGSWFEEATKKNGERVKLYLEDPAILQKQSEASSFAE